MLFFKTTGEKRYSLFLLLLSVRYFKGLTTFLIFLLFLASFMFSAFPAFSLENRECYGTVKKNTEWGRFTFYRNSFDSIIRYIEFEQNGVIWCGGESFLKFNPSSQIWTGYSKIDGFNEDKVSCVIVEKPGSVLFGTKNGISRFSAGSFTNIKNTGKGKKEILSAIRFDSGSLLFGGNGLFIKEGGILEKIRETENMDGMVHSIVSDKNNHIWIGGVLDGIYEYTGETLKKYTKSADCIPEKWILKICSDSKNKKWFISSNQFFSYDGVAWRNYDRFPFRYINALAVDRNDIIWIGADDGLIRFDGQTFEKVDFQEIGNIYSISVDSTNVKWFGFFSKKEKRKYLCSLDDSSLSLKNTERIYPAIESFKTDTFGKGISIDIFLPETNFVELSIIKGEEKKIKSLVSRKLKDGRHTIFWNGKGDTGDYSVSGIYFAVIKVGDTTATRKFLYLR